MINPDWKLAHTKEELEKLEEKQYQLEREIATLDQISMFGHYDKSDPYYKSPPFYNWNKHD